MGYTNKLPSWGSSNNWGQLSPTHKWPLSIVHKYLSTHHQSLSRKIIKPHVASYIHSYKPRTCPPVCHGEPHFCCSLRKVLWADKIILWHVTFFLWNSEITPLFITKEVSLVNTKEATSISLFMNNKQVASFLGTCSAKWEYISNTR